MKRVRKPFSRRPFAGPVPDPPPKSKVEGEWTFTATTVVNKRKDTVPVVRYTIETLVNGVWTDKRTYDGNSYTYTEGTSPATVRLRWYGQPEGSVFVVR